MENTFVKFYYGSNVQAYIDNWETQYKGGIFFDTLGKQIYYNGDLYGKSTSDSSDIDTTLSLLDAAFVSVSTNNEDEKEGKPASLVIEFTNFGGTTSENVKIPIMSSIASTDSSIKGGLISKDDWNKLNSINPTNLVYKGDSGLLTEDLKNLLKGDIINTINEILIDGVKLDPVIDPITNTKTKTVDIKLNDAIQSAVNSVVSSAYTYQGSLNSIEDLENVTSPKVGHVYNLLFSSDEYGAEGVNVAWNGEKWDSLGGVFNTTNIDSAILGLLTQVGKVEGNLSITNNNVSNLSKIIDLMNSDASTDLDGDENFTNEQKYSISYKINTEILNVLKWIEIN